MFTNNCINKNNFAVNLKKIEQKVLNIQKNIYSASKKCDINKVHKIQNDFLKCLDCQFLFIKSIVKQILKKKFVTNDYYWKITIYLYIYICIKRSFSIITYLVKEKVKQYILFLLLQPEWKARFENILCIKQSVGDSKKTVVKSAFKSFYKIHKSLRQMNVDIDLGTKHINSEYLISKINSIKYVTTKLNLWLNSQSLFDHSYGIIQKKSIYYNQDKNCLYKLLQKVIYTGIEWHIYINLKKQKIYKRFILLSEDKLFFISDTGSSNLNIYVAMFIEKLNINLNLVKYSSQKIFDQRIYLTHTEVFITPSSSFKVNLSSNFVKLLLSSIRSVLYHKNHLGQWRLNPYWASNQAKSAIKKILLDWYKSYYHILDSTQIFKVNMIINKIFHTWQIKK